MYVDESHGFQALTESKDKSQSSRGRNPEAKPKLSRPDAPPARRLHHFQYFVHF